MKSLFSFCHFHDFNAEICFHSQVSLFCSLRILLLAVEMSDRKAIRSQGRQNIGSVLLHVREEGAMNDALFAPLSNYREREPAS